MLLWRFLLLAISSSISLSHSMAASSTMSSYGPTSLSEAKLLWEDGTKALEEAQLAELQSDQPLQKERAQKQYKEAASFLQRYVDRYPGSPHYLESHLYLGQAYLGLHQANKAAVALKYCVYSSNVEPFMNLKSRLSLAQANLELGQYALAETVTNEASALIQNHSELPTVLVQRISLLRAEALLQLGQFELSHRLLQNTLDQLNTLPSSPPATELKAEAYLLQMKYRLKECSLLPHVAATQIANQASIEEGQILDQMNRRGTCLLEALLPYRKELELNIFPIAQKASETLQKNLHAYAQTCRAPSASWFVSKKARNEITDVLIDRCHTQLMLGFEFLQSWKLTLPQRMQDLITSIEKTFLLLKRKT